MSHRGRRRPAPCGGSAVPLPWNAASPRAERLGISLAELLRRSLRVLRPADESKPWMRYAGLVASGDAESSLHVDEIVHGQKD